jgi:hypothetical protein
MSKRRDPDRARGDSELDVTVTDDASESLASGYVSDYITGQPVRATPEEIEAVQVFARRLVEDFGYPITHITTRHQKSVSRTQLTLPFSPKPASRMRICLSLWSAKLNQ